MKKGKRILRKLCVLLLLMSTLAQSVVPTAVYAAPVQEMTEIPEEGQQISDQQEPPAEQTTEEEVSAAPNAPQEALYTLDFGTPENGVEITAEKEAYAQGETVIFTVTNSTGREIEKVEAFWGDNVLLELAETDENYVFTMPAGNVTIDVQLVESFVTISSEVKNATIVFDKENYQAGDTVTATLTPENGYVIEKEHLAIVSENTDVPFEAEKQGESLIVTFTAPDKETVLTAEAKYFYGISIQCIDINGQENNSLFSAEHLPERAAEGSTVEIGIRYQGSHGWSAGVIGASGEIFECEYGKTLVAFQMPGEDVTIRLEELEEFEQGDLSEGDTSLGEGIGEEHNARTEKENEPDISLGKTARWDNIEEGTATLTLTEKDTSDWYGRPADYIFVLDRTTTMSLNYRNEVPESSDWINKDNSVCLNPNHIYMYNNRRVKMIDYKRGIYLDTGEAFNVDGKTAKIWDRHYDEHGRRIRPLIENGCIDRLTAAQDGIKEILDVLDYQNKNELSGKVQNRVMYWTYSGAEAGYPDGLWNEYAAFTTDMAAVKNSMVYQSHKGTHYNNSFRQIIRKIEEKQSDPVYRDIPTKVIFISDGVQYGEDYEESAVLAQKIRSLPFTRMYTVLIGDTKDSRAGQLLKSYAFDENHFASVTVNWEKFAETITAIQKDQFEIRATQKILTDRINTKYWEVIGEPVIAGGNGTAALNGARDAVIWNIPEGEGRTYTCKLKLKLKDEYRYLLSDTSYATNADAEGATDEMIKVDPSKAGAVMNYRIQGGEFHNESRTVGIKTPKLKYGTINFEGQKQWTVEGSKAASVKIRLKRTMPGEVSAAEINNTVTNVTKDWKYSFDVRRKPDGSTLPLIKYNNAGQEIVYEVIEELPDYYHQADKLEKEKNGIVNIVFQNEPFKVNVKVHKIDEETKNPLSGAEFSVYAWSEAKKSYVPYKGTNTSMNGADTIVKLTEREKGIYTSPVWLYYSKDNQGKFRLIETKAPEGYFGDWKEDAVTGSDKDKNVYDFAISRDRNKNMETITISNREDGKFGDQRVKGLIGYSKLDEEGKVSEPQGDASLKGAVYKLYAARDIVHQDGTTGVLHPAGEEIKVTKVSEEDGIPVYRYDVNGSDEIVTGERGQFTVTDLELGVYDVLEVRASEGYLVDPLKYETTLAYQGEKQQIVKEKTSVYEAVKKQTLTFYKYTADANSDQLDPMKGAGFSIYPVSELCGGKYRDFSDEDLVQAMIDDLRDTSTLRYDMSDHKPASVFAGKASEDVQSGKLVKRYEYENGKDYTVKGENEYLAAMLESDEKGRVKTPELPYGRYIVIETKTPKGKLATRPFVINVTDDEHDGTTEGDGLGKPLQDKQLTVLIDRPIMSLIRLMKRDEKSNKVVLKEGAAYVIHDLTGAWLEHVTKEMTSSQKKEYREKFGDLVAQYSQGTYYGTKEDPFVTKLIRGAKDETANVYIETPSQLPSGVYELEELRAPEGYVLQGHEGVIAKKESLPGNHTFYEREEDGKWKETPKDRVRFVVSNNESVYDETIGSFVTVVRQDNDPAVGKISVYAEGEKLVSAQKGGTTFVGRLLEKAAGFFGFEKNKGDLTNEEIKAFNDYEFRYEVKPVKGAEFEIRAAEDIDSPEGGVNADCLYNAGDLVMTLITDENGQTWTGKEDWDGTDVAKGLPLGKYTVTQTKAGEGFVLSEENALPRQIEIAYAGQTVPVIYRDTSYTNPRQKVRIEVTKKDKETGTLLSGAVFGLYTDEDIKNHRGKVEVEKGTLIAIARTSVNVVGKVTAAKFQPDLPKGRYLLKELKAPEGYLLSDATYEMDVSGQNGGKDLELQREVFNSPVQAEIRKVDFYTGALIKGAKLRVVEKESGKTVKSWTTEGASRIVEGLKLSGEQEIIYLLQETEPADGYVTAKELEFKLVQDQSGDGTLSESVTVYVKENGKWEACEENILTMKDDITKIEIQKTDKATGKLLSGAKLELRDSKGNLIASWISSESEGYRIERLPIGMYRVLETEKMQGYKEAPPLVIHVEDTQNRQVFVFENRPEEAKADSVEKPDEPPKADDPELIEIISSPVSTGDHSRVIPAAVVMMISLAGILWIVRKRKKS